MAVEVVRGHHAGGAEILEEYPTGRTFEVAEGHLLVRALPKSSTSRGQIIAAFAPSKWAFARHVDKA